MNIQYNDKIVPNKKVVRQYLNDNELWSESFEHSPGSLMLVRERAYGGYRDNLDIDLTRLKSPFYVSPKPLPEVEDEYYLVGGKRFELDNRKGAEWYAGKFAARKGQKPRFELVTVYNRTYDRQDF